jgi:hypothetical protein
LSEIIAAIIEEDGIPDSPELNDKASGLFGTCYAVGCIIAPVLGGYLN